MSSTISVAQADRLIREVHGFASEAAKASKLPGLDSGPGDAFRHIVGAAELTRRIGALPGYLAVEGNETISWVMERYWRLRGGNVGAGRTAEDRTMDRMNNEIGIRLGLRASTPTEILAAAQFEIERAYERGPGVNGAATWLSARSWSVSIRPNDNWPPRNWPNIEAAERVQAYSGHAVASIYRRGEAMNGGPVQVRPHTRDGHAVQGHTRASPAP